MLHKFLIWCYVGVFICVLYCVSHVSKHHKNVIVWGLECLQGVSKSLYIVLADLNVANMAQ